MQEEPLLARRQRSDCLQSVSLPLPFFLASMAFEHATDAIPTAGAPPASDPVRAADAHLGTVSDLLSTLEQPLAPPALLDAAEIALENQLVQVRLGIASSLFGALRA